jgi:uncharacterized protein (DUF2141 family)
MTIDRFRISAIDLFSGANFRQSVSSNPEDIDEYAFIVPFGKSVNLSLTHDFRARGGDADLRVFDDRNRNGRLDTNGSERAVAQSTQSFGINEFINFRDFTGNPFVIGVVNNRGFAPRGSVFYTLRVTLSDVGAANPLAGKEIQLGTISGDLVRRRTINDTNTADNFAFTLDGKSSLNIGVHELGNKKGDVNVRVVQDLNANGLVDKNEVIARGVSTRKGNLDSITGLQSAGDYILQVCQTKGNTPFKVNFDHSAV